ncbi:MAG: holo-ACP synthase [Betaproteobacteria bacterium]|nr:holo-ACP synthase [Betaproteobacteria bacterium]
MIYGVGTDLVSVKRIEDALFRHGDRFLHRILSEAEVAEYAGSSQPARFLAKRFAAKEAFSKAWGTGIGAAVGWHDVSVGHDGRGKPLINPSPALHEKFTQENIVAAHLSLSDEDEHALAFVVLEKQ